MGEREQAGRLPGEIVEAYRAPLPGGGERDPREVVASYRQPDPGRWWRFTAAPSPPGCGSLRPLPGRGGAASSGDGGRAFISF